MCAIALVVRDQSMTIEDGVNQCCGLALFTSLGSRRRSRSRILRAPQFGFLALGRYDGRFDLIGQLVCISVGAPGPIREPLQSTFLITLIDLVAGFTGDLKLMRHKAAMLSPSLSRITNRMRSSITELSFHGTPTPAPFQGKKCNPCLRYVLLPMCRACTNQLRLAKMERFSWALFWVMHVRVRVVMALNVYRRHGSHCSGGRALHDMTYEADELRRAWKKCFCPIYASGTLNGQFKRKKYWDSAPRGPTRKPSSQSGRPQAHGARPPRPPEPLVAAAPGDPSTSCNSALLRQYKPI